MITAPSNRSASTKQQNFEHLKLLFENFIEEFDLSCFSTSHFPSQSKIETSFILLEIPKLAKLLTTLTILENKTEIKVETITRLCWTDLMPIVMPHPYLTKLMTRYFMKLNTSFRFGYFAIDSTTGNISFRVNTNTNFTNYRVDPVPLKVIIRMNLSTSYYALKFHIYKILYMINIISRKQMEDIPGLIENNPKLQLAYRKINSEHISHLDKVKASVIACQTNPPSWQTNQRKLLTFPKPSESPIYNSTIVTPIQILLVDNIKHSVTSGGFGDLSLLQITYKIKGCDGKPIQRRVIMKEEKASLRNGNSRNNMQIENALMEGQRLNNESLVLSHFQYRNSASQFVAKFFDPSETNKREHRISDKAILMEYYPHKSLEHFRMRNYSMSLNTKLWFLVQVANGIRFLCQENVYHLDIKSSNILVQKNYMLKLIDFGESYLSNPHPKLGLYQSNYKENFKPGRTLPYAAPEVVQRIFNPDNLDEKTDVFSFGMMMGEMLFENFLIDFKKSNLANIVQKYQTNTYKIKLKDVSIKAIGPKQLFKYLRIITLLCLNANPKERPTQEWLVITLKEAMQFLDKMY